MTDNDHRRRLDRLRAELADVDHQAHVLAGATCVYLETLAERGDDLAGFLARQAEALFDRRACVAMEVRDMAAELDVDIPE